MVNIKTVFNKSIRNNTFYYLGLSFKLETDAENQGFSWYTYFHKCKQYKGNPQKTEFNFLKLSIYSFSHLQSTIHLKQYADEDGFSTAQNSFRIHQF